MKINLTIDFSAINPTINPIKLSELEQNKTPFSNTSDITSFIISEDYKVSIPFPEWVEKISQIAMDEFNVTDEIKNTTKREVYSASYVIAALINQHWGNSHSLVQIGRMMAVKMGRKKAFDHSTIIVKIRSHDKAVQFRYGYDYYLQAFENIKEKAKALRLI